jgi:tRNA nucleotidyltransferase (CCA-adding enzyme)
VVVEGELHALSTRLGAVATTHGRFGTATVQQGECCWDLAAARAEDYARPGALPDVRSAGIDEDLRRRDVTINAIALELATGELRAVEHARADLDARRLRVLHDASFVDDPTRLWRIARYAARLGFELEERTAVLAAEAVAAGALETVSGSRIGGELRLALREPRPVEALEAVVKLGLAPWLAPDRHGVRAALELLPDGEGRPDLLVLGASLAVTGDEADALLADLELTGAERAVLRACGCAPALAAAAREAASRASALARVLRGVPIEAVALAGAHGAEDAVRRWLEELRHVALAIDGGDLLAAGVPEGPEIGRLLTAVLERRLDGDLGADRGAQLRAALEARDT